MKRSLLVPLMVGLATVLPIVSVDPVAAGDRADADLWAAAGVSRISEPTEAPPVVLNDLAGQRVDLRDLHGRLVMLYFWATW